jgi:hypothetical protein
MQEISFIQPEFFTSLYPDDPPSTSPYLSLVGDSFPNPLPKEMFQAGRHADLRWYDVCHILYLIECRVERECGKEGSCFS